MKRPASKNPQSYPCWMHHRVHGARLFDNSLEFEQAGKGWVDNPARFKEPEGPTLRQKTEKPPDAKPTLREKTIGSPVEYDEEAVERLKLRAKKLGIKGYGLIAKHPAALAQKIAEAEEEEGG